ncbi:type IV secretory system conjugative DNA transfer family protein [Spiroplasma endosymbiont of Atherix ibis]|uniref:type IV secretory system conjugative DNA transfer family protein n=1 Tax=Spiroplasma endosymbiont of Atherix ibis TaxID=3066291 RepID=UPI0030D50968
MHKISKKKRWLVTTIFFLIGLIILISLFLLIKYEIVKVKLLIKYKNFLFIPFIGLVGWYFYITWKIIFNNKSKKAVKNVDTNKIKDFGIARWMHNETEISNLSKQEKTLKEFHHYFGCDIKKCCKPKKEIIKKAAWVINCQYRTKDKNTLVVPPLAKNFEYYDGENNILDTEKYSNSLEKWELEIDKYHFKYNIVYHTLEKLHLLVMGSTGSGKTQKLIFPGIIRNAFLDNKEQPTMVITDPKGEIYEQTSGILELQGYDVKVLNFRDTTTSYSWNPLYISWKYRKEAINYRNEYTFVKTFTNLVTVKEYINKEVIELHNSQTQLLCSIHDTKNCIDCVENFQKEILNNGWEKGEEIKLYVSNGRFHINEYDFEIKVENHIKNLKSLSEKEIMNLASIIIQTSDNGDPFWVNASRTFFIGIAVIMLEIMDKNQDALPLEKFNIVNIIKMMDETNFEEWIEKFRDVKNKDGEDSFGLNQILTVVNSSEQTQKSIITTAKAETTLYTFTSVQGMLCSTQNLINMEEIAYGEKPTILYLIVPDDDKTFHPLVACFVDQLYKTSVKVATNNKVSGRLKEATLSRQIQFYLDEFGNFPKIPTFAQMITVARSRNIFFMLILQDYGQLKTAYGETESQTIKYNCNASIYIRTNDSSTADELSKEYGEKPIVAFNINDKFNRVEKKDYKNKKEEETTNVTTVPLIRGNEILNLDDNFMIVKKSGKNPALLHSIYSYKVKKFKEYMSYKRSFVPSNSINYKKNHYFNFIDNDYQEWINYIGADKELAEWESLNNLDNLEIENNLDFNNSSIEDYHNYNYKSLLEEQNKNIVLQKQNIKSKHLKEIVQQVEENEELDDENEELTSMFYDIEEKFRNKKSMKDQIEKNYFKLEKIKESYYKYSNLLPNEMTTKQKQEYNSLYEQQLKIAEENKKILERCKNSKY